MTQMIQARLGKITEEMRTVANAEGVTVEYIREGVANGTIAIPANKNHTNLIPMAVGKGLRTKVNANIGTSTANADLPTELEKLNAALEAGADAIMDLSLGGDLEAIRSSMINNCPVPIGTVPMYLATAKAVQKYGEMVNITEEDLFAAIEADGKAGVDFITVHCGVTREVVARMKAEGRLTDIVSRGGSFLAGWMSHHGKENPLYEQFDRLLDIAVKYDMTLSLGDGFRPGCLADATDRAQIQELLILGELTERAWARGVQVMIEGPGHVPIDQIEANIKLQKQLCKGAPFYVLGPLVTDVAPGFDHITCAIGGAIAAKAGADFLCYVTPAEHLALPDREDVINGVVATRIAAHAADIAKGVKGAMEWDNKMAKARKALNWEEQIKLSMYPPRAASYRCNGNKHDAEACSMCGEFCAMKIKY